MYRSCYICGEIYGIEEHHVYEGRGRRKLSDKYGMVVDLCNKHHKGSNDSAHFNQDINLKLKCIFQEIFESQYDKETFIKTFGQDYIEKAKHRGMNNPMLKEFEDLYRGDRKKNIWIQEASE